MGRRLRVAASAGLLAGLVALGPGPLEAGPPPQQAVDVDRVVAEMGPEIHRAMMDGSIPSATVALVARGRVLWSGAYGWSNLRARTPATPGTVYIIASTFKAMSAVTLLRLMDRLSIGLDDPVRDHVGFTLKGETPDDPIRFRHLLSHTSGLPTAFSPFPVWADSVLPQLESYVRDELHAVGPPLDSVRYSNPGFTLVAYLVERLSGQAFREHVRTELFEPLGMTSTAFIPTPEMQERQAIPYLVDEETGSLVPGQQLRFLEWPAGSVYGTVEDQAKWLAANLSGELPDGRPLLPPALRDVMFEIQYPELAVPNDFFQGTPTGYGLAWWLNRRRGERYFFHSGSVPGQTTVLYGNLDHGLGVAILTNGNRGHAHLWPLADRILELMKGSVAVSVRGDP